MGARRGEQDWLSGADGGDFGVGDGDRLSADGGVQ